MYPGKYDSESVAQLLLVMRDDNIVEYSRCITFNRIIREVNKLHGGTLLVGVNSEGESSLWYLS